jgi:minor extracellular protease Epr
MRRLSRMARWAVLLAAPLVCGAAGAQLLPPLPPPLGDVVGEADRLGSGLADRALGTAAGAARLADIRLDRLRAIVRAAPEVLEMTALGPAVRGEIVAADPASEALAAARAAGFETVGEEEIEGLGLRTVTLRAPFGLSLDKALERLRRVAAGAEFSANHLHFQSAAAPAGAAGRAALAGGGAATGGRMLVGIIDGGVAAHPVLPGSAEQKGFARGAPVSSAHGTAVASLLVGGPPMRAAAPGAHLLVADVYGRDPAGGNSAAIARALGWMAERRVPVVGMSLVGPANPLVGKAVERAQARGVKIVAAVGNDGPAAPPAYPASYPGVVAVTGVDGRNRPLPEAGRALRLDYAAPGAEMAAAALGRRFRRVRGTSYAVPLVTGRLALATARGASLDAEAQDLGPKGPDRRFGRGLVCGACRTPLQK